MLTIEVHKERPFIGFRRLSSELRIVNRGNAAYVSLSRRRTIPVSDKLAAFALGARRQPCPNTGDEPVFALFEPERYFYFSSLSDSSEVFNGSNLIGAVCPICGYSCYHADSIDAWRPDSDGNIKIAHPATTYLVSEREEVLISNASWHNGQFDLPNSQEKGRLIVCVSSLHLSKNRASDAAKIQFPSAKHVGEVDGCIILRDYSA